MEATCVTGNLWYVVDVIPPVPSGSHDHHQAHTSGWGAAHLKPPVWTLWSPWYERSSCVFLTQTTSSSSGASLCAAEVLAAACALHEWRGGSSDELEVESSIAESFVPPEINRRRNAPHQTSIFQTSILKKTPAPTIRLYEATWQDHVPRLHWTHAHINGRSIHSNVRIRYLHL